MVEMRKARKSADHLSADRLERANLKAVESGKLKGAARAAKVGEALTALTGLEHEFAKRVDDAKAKEDTAAAHMAALKKELAAKQDLLS